MYSGLLVREYLEVQTYNPYLQPANRMFGAVVGFREPAGIWDFSPGFQVNMKEFDRKNSCFVVCCTSSWPLLVVVSQNQQPCRSETACQEVTSYFFSSLLAEVVWMPSSSSVWAVGAGCAVNSYQTHTSLGWGWSSGTMNQRCGPFVDNTRKLKGHGLSL